MTSRQARGDTSRPGQRLSLGLRIFPLGIKATFRPRLQLEIRVDYAREQGAPTVEAYPCAGAARTKDDNVWYGTKIMFRRVGFRVVRKPLEDLPINWVPRVTMRMRSAP